MMEGTADPGDAAAPAERTNQMRLIATMTADRTQIVFSPTPLPESSALS
jgi:hypothetical protein